MRRVQRFLASAIGVGILALATIGIGLVAHVVKRLILYGWKLG